MTRILTEGFEAGDGLFWTTAAGAIASGGRTGAYYWNDNVNTACVKNFSATGELYFRAAFVVNNFTNNFFVLRNSTTAIVQLKHNGTNLIAIVNGTTLTGTYVYTPSTWILIEFYLNISDTGQFTLKVEGIEDMNFSGDTLSGALTTVDNFYIIRPSAAAGSGTVGIDDIGINNTTGGVDDTWLGDGRIIALLPNGNGDTNQWTGSDTNSTDNYLLVDERPSNSDTDYVQDGTAGHQDMYAMGDFSGTGLSIERVWAEVRARDSVAGGSQIKVGIKTESTVYVSSAKTLTTSYIQVKGDEHRVNPNTSSAWTDTQLDAIQAVIEVV